MPLSVPTFDNASNLQVRLLLDDSLKQESGRLDIIVRGICYTVDYDRQCVTAWLSGAEGGAEASVNEHKLFFVNTRELWDEADSIWADEGLAIARLLLTPPADVSPIPEQGATGGTATPPSSSPWGVPHNSPEDWAALLETQNQELNPQQDEANVPLPTPPLANLHLNNQPAATSSEDEQGATGGGATASPWQSSPWGVRHDRQQDWDAVWEAQSQELSQRMTSSATSSSLDSDIDRPQSQIAERMYMRRLWGGPASDFKAALSSYSFDALVRLGGVCESERYYSLAHKKHFCERAQQLLARAKNVDLKQISWLLRPYHHQDCHSTALMQQLGDRISAIMVEGDLTTANVHHLRTIYKVMVQTSFYHPCQQDMIRYISQLPLKDIGFSLSSHINLFRYATMHDALVTQSRQENQTVRTALLDMYKQLDGLLQQTQLKPHHEEMVRWIKLYGRYVLGLDTSIKKFQPQDTIISIFQQKLEARLRPFLPGIDLVVEKLLPDLELSADLYCEPKIVIEADGVTVHTSIDLDCLSSLRLESLGERLGATLWFEQRDANTSRILSSTILKTCIMEAAGYTVCRVIDCRSRTVRDLAGIVRGVANQHLGIAQK